MHLLSSRVLRLQLRVCISYRHSSKKLSSVAIKNGVMGGNYMRLARHLAPSDLSFRDGALCLSTDEVLRRAVSGFIGFMPRLYSIPACTVLTSRSMTTTDIRQELLHRILLTPDLTAPSYQTNTVQAPSCHDRTPRLLICSDHLSSSE